MIKLSRCHWKEHLILSNILNDNAGYTRLYIGQLCVIDGNERNVSGHPMINGKVIRLLYPKIAYLVPKLTR